MTLTTILAEAQQGSGMSSLLMIVAMIAIFYFVMIRPQQKRQKEEKKQREALQKGDRVVTAGGIHGRIRKVNETTFEIEIASDVTITVEKTSVYPEVAPAQSKNGKAAETAKEAAEKK